MKKSLSIILAAIFLTIGLIGCQSSSKNSEKDTKENKTEQTTKNTKGKKAILVVSFGTSYADTRKACIESTENKIKETFKDYDVKRAFTSEIIIKKLKERDKINVDNVDEALANLDKEGYSEVYVQPLHIMPGEEYDGVVDSVKKYQDKKAFDKLVVGRPILYREKDYEIAKDALMKQIPNMNKNQAVILMGHGSAHPGNASYSLLQYVLESGKANNVYVATVEGYPTLDNVIKKLKDNNITEVTLMPFMLVAGDHAKNDMAGDDKDSWKNILKNEGFKVNIYLHGLGENKAFQDIYVQHVKDCINGDPLLDPKKDK
ncbi:sirohydrochlorin cobaltochelatase [Clostridium acetireducens DSM 10703]|uniref:Sirohydrochlorin cobaltochelatase n=1 Tax=Clostridium acetireducens DSM 10703 TaxID=1121290 RepID=A0A1E8EZW4_9CLOT|nr:sirohydrochlorin cobaltochelatase [Clostridium acetireducens]OFI06714.1 sirohydrochlorin cobaltochelatase [Clostridium acetireducens DSM 10703]